jgi:hypothetical protein
MGNVQYIKAFLTEHVSTLQRDLNEIRRLLDLNKAANRIHGSPTMYVDLAPSLHPIPIELSCPARPSEICSTNNAQHSSPDPGCCIRSC